MLAFILGLTVAWLIHDTFYDDFGCHPDRDEDNTDHYFM
jgi:hypothetical protein